MPDRPAHMLEIPESLGRDVDRAREGTLKKDLPVEAFMSDAALEQAQKNTAAATGPVHAEDLVPVSRQDAARLAAPPGGGVPSVPQPRRVIPAPFRRPRISAGRHGKEWTRTAARGLVPGDLVTGVGLIESAQEQTVYTTLGDLLGPACPAGRRDEKVATGTVVAVTGAGGVTREFDPGESVPVFRKPSSPA